MNNNLKNKEKFVFIYIDAMERYSFFSRFKNIQKKGVFITHLLSSDIRFVKEPYS